MAYTKEVRQLIAELKDKGWRIETSKRNSHYKAYPPKGKGFVVISSSPSCHHWRKNVLGDLKRVGGDYGLLT